MYRGQVPISGAGMPAVAVAVVAKFACSTLAELAKRVTLVCWLGLLRAEKQGFRYLRFRRICAMLR